MCFLKAPNSVLKFCKLNYDSMFGPVYQDKHWHNCSNQLIILKGQTTGESRREDDSEAVCLTVPKWARRSLCPSHNARNNRAIKPLPKSQLAVSSFHAGTRAQFSKHACGLFTSKHQIFFGFNSRWRWRKSTVYVFTLWKQGFKRDNDERTC